MMQQEGSTPERSNIIPFPYRANAPQPEPACAAAAEQAARMFRTQDFLTRTCGLPPESLMLFQPLGEYGRGDVIAATVKSTALYRGGFTIARIRRITRTRITIENDRGTFIFNRRDIEVIGKAVEGWRKDEDWNRRPDDDAGEWPEYIDEGGAA